MLFDVEYNDKDWLRLMNDRQTYGGIAVDK
jgi:hypothetical protein